MSALIKTQYFLALIALISKTARLFENVKKPNPGGNLDDPVCGPFCKHYEVSNNR